MSNFTLAFIAKMFITELSPKYETKRLYMTWLSPSTSFVPLLLFLISCVFFIYFVLIYPPTQNQSMCQPIQLSLSLLLLLFKMYPPTLSLSSQKRNKHACLQLFNSSIHHRRTYLFFFPLIKKDLCNDNLHSYISGSILQWNTLSFFFFSILAILVVKWVNACVAHVCPLDGVVRTDAKLTFSLRRKLCFISNALMLWSETPRINGSKERTVYILLRTPWRPNVPDPGEDYSDIMCNIR